MDLEPIVVRLLADASQFTRVFDQAQTQLVRTAGTFRVFGDQIATSIETGMSRAASGVVNAVSRIGQTFVTALQSSATMNAVGRAFDTMTGGIAARYDRFRNTLHPNLSGRNYNVLESALRSMGVGPNTVGALGNAWSSVVGGAGSIGKYLIRDFADTASAVSTLFSDAWNAVSGSRFMGTVRNAIGTVANGFRQVATDVSQAFASAWQIVSGSRVGRFAGAVGSHAGDILAGLGTDIAGVASWAGRVAGPVMQTLGSAFLTAGQRAAPVIGSAVATTIRTGFQVATNLTGTVASTVVGLAGKMWERVTGVLTNPLALVGGTALVGYAGKQVVQLAADFEKASIAFEVMTGSAETGKKLLDDIVQFGIESPFKTSQLIPVAKELKAFGVETEAVMPVLRSIANVAAGTDMPLSRIALAFGQVRVAGRLTGDELRQFVNAGVPINEYVAKVMKVPLANVRGFIEENKVGLNIFQDAWNMMVRDKFPNMTQRLNDTVAGQWNSLMERIELGMRNVGLAFFKGFGLKDVLREWSDGFSGLTGSVDALVPTFQRVREVFDIMVGAGKAVLDVLGNEFGKLVQSLTGNAMNWDDAKTGAKQFVETVVIGFGIIIDQIKTFGRELVNNVLIPLGDLMNKAGITGQKSVYQTERDKGGSMLWSAFKSFNAWQNEQFLLFTADEKTKSLLKGLQDFANRNPFQWLKDTMDKFTEKSDVGGDMLARLNAEWDKMNANAANTANQMEGGIFGSVTKWIKAQAAMDAAKVPNIEALDPKIGQFASKIKKDMEDHGVDIFSHFSDVTEKLFLAHRGVPDSFVGPVMPGTGLINDQELMFGLAKNFDELQKHVGAAVAHMPPAAFIGSAEAQDTVNRSMYEQKSVMEEVRQAMVTANEMARVREQRLREIAEAVKANKAMIVTKPPTK